MNGSIKFSVRFNDMQITILVLVLVSSATAALTNVAYLKPYTVDSPGFIDVVFQSHNSSGYYHSGISDASLHDEHFLTSDSPVPPIPSVVWTSSTDFNVTMIIDLESAYITKEVLIQGKCCNMGVYTPTDAHLYGSLSQEGPWTWLGGSSNLESGDQTDTPATRYRLHFVNSYLEALRFMRVVVTGLGNRYMSIRTVSIFA